MTAPPERQPDPVPPVVQRNGCDLTIPYAHLFAIAMDSLTAAQLDRLAHDLASPGNPFAEVVADAVARVVEG